jgi:hypothetical protein
LPPTFYNGTQRILTDGWQASRHEKHGDPGKVAEESQQGSKQAVVEGMDFIKDDGGLRKCWPRKQSPPVVLH